VLRLLLYYLRFQLSRRLIVAKRQNKNGSDIAKGDEFNATTTVTLVDAGNGLTDVTLTHIATKNGELFVESVVNWYGMSAVAVAAIQDSLSKAKLVCDAPQKHKGFKALVKEWRKLTQALGHLNDHGDELPNVD
jgi:hypothetical protein